MVSSGRMERDVQGKRVFVGLSGGVDSAVSAALLARAGARVVGVFIKGWYPPDMPCSWAADRRDAMRVAARLNIPFATLDASEAYKKSVVDYLLAEYAAGRTPNPDIMCNRDIKFGAFADFAQEHGAHFIATGHYARVNFTAAGHPLLLRGKDLGKDQSYFLWAVPAPVLARTLFPVGSLHKDAVRRYARSFRLPVARKKDSQGICFLGDVSVEDLLRHEFPVVSGLARDEEGREVGRHQGAILYTLGERVALAEASPGPWYVRAKNLNDNVLIVSRTPPHASVSHVQDITLSSCNWISDSSRAREAHYRYHGPRIAGRITLSDTIDTATFHPTASLPEPAVPGQSLVAYAGEECVGGGIIA